MGKITTGRGRTSPTQEASLEPESPLVAGYIEVGAQGAPHLARVLPVFDGLHRGPSAERRQHVVDEQRCSAHGAELLVDQYVEFGQSHIDQLTQ